MRKTVCVLTNDAGVSSPFKLVISVSSLFQYIKASEDTSILRTSRLGPELSLVQVSQYIVGP